MRRPRGRLVATWSAALLVTGCAVQIPADPEGTLARVRGGELRVGISPNEPWTTDVDTDQPAGIEPDLVREFAASLRARVQWFPGGEEALIEDLARGQLDLVIGGLTAKSPWAEQAALTQPYATVAAEGEPEDHVLAAPIGENAFLLELDRFLLAQEVTP